MQNRKFVKGEKYRPVVHVDKVKNDVPTVLKVSGRRYVLDHQDNYQNTRSKNRGK